jgi:NAD(P)-dependent dehydrogenase (short-subunit alcohol dehydrogenase family)
MDVSKPEEAMNQLTALIQGSDLSQTGIDYVFNNAGIT